MATRPPAFRRPTRHRPRGRPSRTTGAVFLVLAALIAACGPGEDGIDGADGQAPTSAERPPSDTSSGIATAMASGEPTLSEEELEAGRHDASWRQYVDGGAASPADSTPSPESWEDIGSEGLERDATHLPLFGDVAGPSVLTVQILLDRTLFRPGVMDGRWGKNTEKAVYWFQTAHGLEATGTVDEATFERLDEVAGSPQELVVERSLTEEDVAGPFVDLPDDVYGRAEMECLCYESLREKLAERFHTAPGVLEQLNPDVDLDAVSAGDPLLVPDVRPFSVNAADAAAHPGRTPSGEVTEIVVSDGGRYLHARDAAGEILYHFPSTLGSDYAPSPSGDYTVDSIHQDPTWHYQPELLTGVDPSEEDAVLPAGPNNAVGVVWMQLSRPHYGIHGTSAPETIGYATSHGCIRLTNWDARFLSEEIEAGVPVRFIDGTGRGEEASG